MKQRDEFETAEDYTEYLIDKVEYECEEEAG